MLKLAYPTCVGGPAFNTIGPDSDSACRCLFDAWACQSCRTSTVKSGNSLQVLRQATLLAVLVNLVRRGVCCPNVTVPTVSQQVMVVILM